MSQLHPKGVATLKRMATYMYDNISAGDIKTS